MQKGRSSAIYAADGSLIGFIQLRTTSASRFPRGRCRRTLKDATVAIEDQNFFNHGAIDPAAIVRAAWKNLLAGGKPVQGASTITQQLVRNLYIQNPEETIERKLIEAHLAYEQEEEHSKEWILTAYLNTAPYGTVEGETAVGAEAAAQTYFGKPAKELEPDRGGDDRRPAAGALRIQPVPRPAGRDRAPQRGAGGDGGARATSRPRELPRGDRPAASASTPATSTG